MTNYKYKAINNYGKKVTGIIEANDEFSAAEKIKESCPVIEKIEAVAPSKHSATLDALNEPMSISEKAISLLSSQFAILLKAGIPTSRTVEIIAEQQTDKYLKKVFTEVAKDVQAGYRLSTSHETRSSKFPGVFTETIRAGEESGSLDRSFTRLAAYYEKSYKIKSKVKSALTYPLFLSILAVIVVIVVVKVAVPAIAGAISDTGGELPAPTKILLGIYDFFSAHGLIVLAVILLLVILFKLWQRTEDGKLKTSQWAFKIPVLGNINLMNAASQFAGSMTTLLASGLPLTQVLSITGKVMDNYAAGQSVMECAKGVEEGQMLGSVLNGNPYLPPLLVEMTTVGETSGTLEDTLDTIGKYFDSEVEQASAKALGILEPVITIVMGVVIGFIVISLYLPMFTMYSGM